MPGTYAKHPQATRTTGPDNTRAAPSSRRSDAGPVPESIAAVAAAEAAQLVGWSRATLYRHQAATDRAPQDKRSDR